MKPSSAAFVLVAAMFLGGFGSGPIERPQPAEAADRATTTLVLPKGTYTAIVFTAAGAPNATHAIAVLKVGSDQFPVNLAPGVTVSVPFGSGWTLERDAEIRLNNGSGSIAAVPSAWAVTPRGPLELKPR